MAIIVFPNYCEHYLWQVIPVVDKEFGRQHTRGNIPVLAGRATEHTDKRL
jgi:hypothetical protein